MVRLFARGMKYIALTLFPITLGIAGFAHEGLQWWLGDEFALHSTSVLQCLAVGVFVNGLAQVFATLIQGVGRPDLSAKLHLFELPIYLFALWWAIENHGIVGAAIAWTGRVILDGVLLFWLSSDFLGDNALLLKRMTTGLLLALGALAAPLLIVDLFQRAVVVLLIFAAFVPIAWFLVLAGEERASIKGRFGWSGAL
jgi:O-antigen/teichoic acid export membrane protein